ncbi:ABC transporter permease [Elongatibacter sediminis]|uniref:ABC transporter permease n=1 Tax=Elongatibacter sediminis TaxID=3119006 RepID=A0AAW9REA2_9GAMM
MRRALRKLFQGLALVLGVTLISFLLMVYFGPDQTFTLVGKNASEQQIREVRRQLGYDQPFVVRYADYVGGLFTLDLGASHSSGEPVRGILGRTLPVTLALVLPGFVLGNLIAIALGLVAAWHRGGWLDRLISGVSVAGMSLSFLIIVIALQVLLCTPYGLNLFPARGWNVTGPASYVQYVTVPTLSLLLATLGYNTRFFRAVFVEESGREHIRTARAFGASPAEIMVRHVLRNSLAPLITRTLFSLPLIVVSGSLLLETYFGVPGLGRVTFDAITNGDQPVLQAVVGLTAVAFVVVQAVTDGLYRLADPRVQ